jgi:uroporphyrinogen-III synthase
MRHAISILILSAGIAACSFFSGVDTKDEAAFVAVRSVTSITRELTQACRRGTFTRDECADYSNRLMLAKTLLTNAAEAGDSDYDLRDAMDIIDFLEYKLRTTK